jgi:hypothetical protein
MYLVPVYKFYHPNISISISTLGNLFSMRGLQRTARQVGVTGVTVESGLRSIQAIQRSITIELCTTQTV